MPEGLGWLITATAVGAAVLVAHLALFVAVVRSDLATGWKWASLVPLVTPVAAWKADKKFALMAWTVCVLAYIVIRLAW